MDIKLNWTNYNTSAEEVRIYRSESKFTEETLPTVLATLPANATEYTDTTAVRGTLYYYGIGVVQGSTIALVKNIAIKAITELDTGPGPTKLIRGDWDLGYFGWVSANDFITNADISTMVGISDGTVLTDYGWLKVAYKGKVLFVDKAAARTLVPYTSIYSAGVVFGTNDDGLYVPPNVTPTNQRKIVVIQNKEFIPRILTGLDSNITPSAPKTTEPFEPTSYLGDNEWDDIIGSFSKYPRFTGDTEYGKLGSSEDIFPFSNLSSEHISEHTVVFSGTFNNLRGGRQGSTVPMPAYITTYAGTNSLTAVKSGSVFFIGKGLPIQYAWRPVLELVEV